MFAPNTLSRSLSESAQQLVEDLGSVHVRIPHAVALGLIAEAMEPRAPSHGRIWNIQAPSAHAPSRHRLQRRRFRRA